MGQVVGGEDEMNPGLPGMGGSGTPSNPMEIPTPSDPTGKTYAPLKPAAATMRRLTEQQVRNSVADIFGAATRITAALDPDETSSIFRSVGAATVGTADSGVEAYRNAALDVVRQVWPRRDQIPMLAGCGPARLDEPCLSTLLRNVGLRLWRRPLTDEEVRRYTAVVGAGGTAPASLQVGLQFALAGMLQSPHFLYLVPVGEIDPMNGARRFTSYEMASRLSYFILDSTPDQALLDAAAAGKLVTSDGLNAEAKRLLVQARARGVVTRHFSESWGVAIMGEPDKSKTAYPMWNAAVVRAYKEEFRRVLEDIVFDRPRDVRGVFDGRETFANRDLASVYGMTLTAPEFTRVSLDANRSGLFTSGAVVAANSPSDRTSPTRRGAFIRERILCQIVPAPPPDVNTDLPPPNAAKPASLRERLEQHRKDPACTPCHAVIDPPGLTLENFDAIGVFRTRDNGSMIDASGLVDGQSFQNAREFAASLKGNESAGRCIAHELYAQAAAHEPTEGEHGVIDSLYDQVAANGFTFQDLVVRLVASNGFRYFVPVN